MNKFNVIFFLALMLFSVFGRSVEVHYCNGEITEAVFFGSVECCCAAGQNQGVEEVCHEEEEQHCHPSNDGHVEHESSLEETCCETAVFEFFQSVDFDLSQQQQSLQTVIFCLSIFKPAYFINCSIANQTFVQYQQPLLWSDLSVRFQTFLI